MYKEFWGIEEFPFENVPDPRFFYPSAEHQEALLRLFCAVNSKGAAMLTGEVGCGKTILSRTLAQDLQSDRYEVGVVANPRLSPIEFLRGILYQLGVEEAPDSRPDLLQALNDRMVKNHDAGKDTVIIVDEAQALEDPETLEELLLLLNFQLNGRFLATLLLIGQSELRERISRIKQLEQRVSIKFHLGPLKQEETHAYIQSRLEKVGLKRKIFENDAVDAVYRASRGIPREINNTCDICLLLGFGARVEEIDTTIVQKACEAVEQF